MSTTVETRTGTSTSGSVRAGAVVLGLLFGGAVEVMAAVVKPRLMAISNAEAATWPIAVIFGLFVLLGAGTAAVVLVSPRQPWLPTAAAVVLLYGLVASFPTIPTWSLPYPGDDREFVLVPTMAGILTTTAVWSWWSSRRRQRGA